MIRFEQSDTTNPITQSLYCKALNIYHTQKLIIYTCYWGLTWRAPWSRVDLTSVWVVRPHLTNPSSLQAWYGSSRMRVPRSTGWPAFRFFMSTTFQFSEWFMSVPVNKIHSVYALHHKLTTQHICKRSGRHVPTTFLAIQPCFHRHQFFSWWCSQSRDSQTQKHWVTTDVQQWMDLYVWPFQQA